MQEMFRAAGVGSQNPQGKEVADADNLGASAQAQQSQEADDEYGNFIPYTVGDDEQDLIDETPDPRDAQLELMQAQLDKAMQIIQGFQNAPPQQIIQQVPQNLPPAPIDFNAGYEPTDFIDRFSQDPNTAMAYAPIMRQTQAELAALRNEIKELRSFREEQLYYEAQGVSDLEDRKGLRSVMQQDPGEVIRKAYEYDKQQRLAKAKEAEGLKGANQPQRPDPKAAARRVAAARTAPQFGNVQNFMANLAARQRRG
jgi:hypothetical protein